MAPHSGTFAWKIPWTEEPGRLQSTGSLESDMTERLHFHFSLSHIGEGNGNPLQCSCLENPRDGGAWWAAIYGVAQSQTRLKRLSSSSSSRFELGSSLNNSMKMVFSIWWIVLVCSLTVFDVIGWSGEFSWVAHTATSIRLSIHDPLWWFLWGLQVDDKISKTTNRTRIR